MKCCWEEHGLKEECTRKEKDHEVRSLFKDILANMVCENAGADSNFAYFWTKDWLKLKERIQKVIGGG